MWPSERKFANLLNRQNRKWEYPAKRFELNGTTYPFKIDSGAVNYRVNSTVYFGWGVKF